MRPDLAIHEVSWAAESARLSDIRRRVFIKEQAVPESMEWDEFDTTSQHWLAVLGDHHVGCGRLLADGHIGRMAVLPDYRNQGIGAAILSAILDTARRRFDVVELSAQTHAAAFYQRAGFVAVGKVYDEVNIPHQRMVLRFAPP